MAYSILFKGVAHLTNAESLEGILSKRSGELITHERIRDINEFAQRIENHTYCTADFKPCSRKSNLVRFFIANTGLTVKGTNTPLYISVKHLVEDNGVYGFGLCDTLESLKSSVRRCDGVSKYLVKPSNEGKYLGTYMKKSDVIVEYSKGLRDGETDNSPQSVYDDAFIENLKNILLFPDLIKSEGTGLSGYAYAVTQRVLRKVEKHDAGKLSDKELFSIVRLNSTKDKLILNLGLLDKLSNDIILMYNLSPADSRGRRRVNYPKVVASKSDLVNLGFSKSDILTYPSRVSFYQSPDELIFSATMDDFDFNDRGRLLHCIQDRRDRFPREFSDMADEALAQDMISAIRLAIRISKYDYTYIQPMYDIPRDRIVFVVPYFIGGDMHKENELGIVVAESKGFWTATTVLFASDADYDARTLSPYRDIKYGAFA